MKKLLIIICIVFFGLQVKSQIWYRYAYNDSAQTIKNTPVVIHVLANDSLKPPLNSYNYIAHPVTCDYLYRYGSLQSEQGGTLIILNYDSIQYTPATNFIGKDHFYYGICNSGSSYQTDTAVVTVKVNQLNTILNYASISSSVKLYPNPSDNNLTLKIRCQVLPDNLKLYFFNVLGEKVKETLITSSISNIQTENLATGIYIYQLQNQSELIKTGKIIIK